MRIISGFLKSGKLKGHNLPGTRPTMDNVKESLFAIIQNQIKDSLVLDLFAGSGSLGIEAISNGAKHVYFVDNNPKVIEILNENIKNLNIKDSSDIIFKKYNIALEYFITNNIKFDLIFLDPPYNLLVLEDVLNIINEKQLLKKGGQVICEYEEDYLKDNYGKLKCIRNKKYGNKKIRIYEMN